MKEVLFSSIRARLGRLLATGLAVTLAVGFVVTTLLLSESYKQTLTEGLTAQMAQADAQIVLTTDDPDFEKIEAEYNRVVEQARTLDTVAAADVQRSAYTEVVAGNRRAQATIEPLLSAENRWQELATGTWPAAEGEVALSESSAESLSVALGDTVRTNNPNGAGLELTVVGLTSDKNAGFNLGAPVLLVNEATIESLDATSFTTGILISGTGAVTPQELVSKINEDIDLGPNLTALTREAAVERQMEELSGNSTMLLSIMLVFGVVSLLVAGFVIANTFQVLIAQRTNELALLRCVGAGVGQVYRLIISEAALIGLLFSTIGAAIGIGVSQALVAASDNSTTSLPLSQLSVPPMMVLGAIVCGTIVTVIFALKPARNATKVRPAAALRPVTAVPTTSTTVTTSIIGTVLSLLAIAAMIFAAKQGSIVLAIGAGAVTVIGLLVLASALLPKLIKFCGLPLSRISAATELAVANIDRNQRRTATTGAALLIGSILLATLMTGITSTRESIVEVINAERPIDLVVANNTQTQLDPAIISAVENTRGVVDSTAVSTGQVEVLDSQGESREYRAEGYDLEELQQVAHSKVTIAETGQLKVNDQDPLRTLANKQVTVRGSAGEQQLTVILDDDTPEGTIILAATDLEAVESELGTAQLLLRLDDNLSSTDTQTIITDMLSIDNQLSVNGGAQERVYYYQILDTMLMVVLALLGVSVVIAIVGIGNTAALSVIERRRESAMLRAVGLGRGQLITMICTEAALTAVVSAGIGIVAGVFFGWTGLVAFGNSATKVTMQLHIPIGQLLIVLLGAALAGILAALVPASAASRRRPVEDLVIT